MTPQGKLYEKLWLEYNGFLDKLRSMPTQQIIEAAYEKVIKEEILAIFEDRGLLSDSTAQILLNKNISLEDLYKGWKSAEINRNEILNEYVASMVFDYEHEDLAALLKNPDIMPDYTITKAEMEHYGYNDNSMMLPLSVQVSGYKDMAPLKYDVAHNLFMQGHDIYLLFNGDTEEKVYDSSQLEVHKGGFGIKREDWLKIEENKKYPDIDQHHPGQYANRNNLPIAEKPKQPAALSEKQPTSTNEPPIMPDSSITIAEMRNYGYIYEGEQPYEMLPLRVDRAIELFNQDCEVFLLYDDNGEGAANSIEEINSHGENGGIFGIEYDVWLKSKEYQELAAQAKAAENEWKTYKVELSVPDDEYMRMEIILAVDDEDAINQAYEFENEEGVFLHEIHELDDDYNIIREVNLLADHSLRRFMGVDLIDFLGKIANKVIIHYPQDFKHDIEILWKKALLENPSEQKLMWHCSSYGTHTLNEDEVFTENTGAYGYWVDYRSNEPDMMGYVIEVTGYHETDDTVVGNVYEVGDYSQHAAYVRQAALQLDSVSLTYSDNWGINAGKTITVPHSVYDKDRHRLMSESGDVVGIKYHPLENQLTMAERLRSEQRNRMCMQIGNTDEHLQKIDAKLAAIRGDGERTQEAESIETPKNEIPVYKDYWYVADDKGEEALFHASNELNQECSQAIDNAVNANSRSGEMAGTLYVNAKQAVTDVIAEYGAERVTWVLAGNVQAAKDDKRLSGINRDWAESIEIPKESVYLLSTHRYIVNSLVKSLREIEQEKAMPKKTPQEKKQEKTKKPKRCEDR